jgi:hypothetical protein
MLDKTQLVGPQALFDAMWDRESLLTWEIFRLAYTNINNGKCDHERADRALALWNASGVCTPEVTTYCEQKLGQQLYLIAAE